MNTSVLGFVLAVYVVAMFAIAFVARSRIHSAEDYLVAGRRLPLPLAWATLFATWFGAGTLLTATDTVREQGLRAAALEPIGAGMCLVVAGLFYARRLWEQRIVTLPDFYGRRFGVTAEVTASVIMVPGYFGWIAAQFVALAGLLELYWSLPATTGIFVVAVVGAGYTLIGGMWSVTLTDAVQLVILLLGLLVLAFSAFTELGDGAGVGAGFARLVEVLPPDRRVLVPGESAEELLGWLAVLAIGMLGNLPGQDLAQRIFASKSARVATYACVLAGLFYVLFGFLPVLSGLAADFLGGGGTGTASIAQLASVLLSPWMGMLFVLALASAVLSTIDSAILAPGSVLANNIFRRLWPAASPLALCRRGVALVALASLGTAWLGESAYSLLETAYAIGMVGLFVPLTLGLFTGRGRAVAALASMGVGTLVWAAHLLLGWEGFGGPLLGDVYLPQELVATALSWVAFEAAALWERRRSIAATAQRGAC
jgi:Na+/proline symporter